MIAEWPELEEGCVVLLEPSNGLSSGQNYGFLYSFGKLVYEYVKVCYFHTDVLAMGMWDTLAGYQQSDLRTLADSLQSTVLSSRAPSTTSKYLYGFSRWKTWAQAHDGVVTFPAREAEFAMYLQHVGNVTASKAAVEEAVNTISWAHHLAGYPDMSESPFVRMVLDGLQRQLAKPKVRKEPISSDMLVTLVNSLGTNPTLTEVRLVAACLLAYSAFLRYDELAKLRCCDVTFSVNHMSVYIASSKTDQYRQGDRVLVARTGSPTCPVSMLERYFAMAVLSTQSRLRLFRGIIMSRTQCLLSCQCLRV